jgi:transcriptional regulator with XRE-family HTH domain
MGSLGDRLKKCRSLNGLTFDELSKRSGISKGFLSDVENGKRGISAENLQVLAGVFNTTLDFLMTGKQRAQADKPLNIPAGLALLASKHALSFSKVLILLSMSEQVLARRTGKAIDDTAWWESFYGKVKDFLPDE